MDKVPTLSEWMGGFPAIEALFKKFYDKVLLDDMLYPLFKNMDNDHPGRNQRSLYQKN